VVLSTIRVISSNKLNVSENGAASPFVLRGSSLAPVLQGSALPPFCLPCRAVEPERAFQKEAKIPKKQSATKPVPHLFGCMAQIGGETLIHRQLFTKDWLF
jgi:hypothetical protein